MKFHVFLIIIVLSLSCHISADAPGMIVLKVKLVTLDNIVDTAFVSITWSDRMNLGKLGVMNHSTNLLDIFKNDEFSNSRELTRYEYKISNLKNKPSYCYYYNHENNLVLSKDSPRPFNSVLFFTSHEETEKLILDKYKSISFVSYAHELGDCSGLKKLSKNAISVLMKKDIVNIVVINAECSDIILFNFGDLPLKHLKILGKFYYNHRINITAIEDESFKSEIQKILKLKKGKNYKGFSDILREFFFNKGVVVFVEEWD